MEPEAEPPAPKKRKGGEWPACRNACGSQVHSPAAMYCTPCEWQGSSVLERQRHIPGSSVLAERQRNIRHAELSRRWQIAVAAGGKAELPLCQSSCGKRVENVWSRFCQRCVTSGKLFCPKGAASNFEFRLGIRMENAISGGRSWVVPYDFRPRVVGYYPRSPTNNCAFACFPKGTWKITITSVFMFFLILIPKEY